MTQQTDGKRRYPRKIAAWPAWVRFHRSSRMLQGRTANVSRSGAYIVLPVDGDVDAGEPVDFMLRVETEDGGRLVIQTINGEAQVVRVQKGKDGGLALRFDGEKDLP